VLREYERHFDDTVHVRASISTRSATTQRSS
jgi:hypothetical protein